jgi:hypothetical protein
MYARHQGLSIVLVSVFLMCVPLLLVCIVTQREMLLLEKLKLRPECLREYGYLGL